MLVRAHLPMQFYLLAYDYAYTQLRVLPAKDLVDVEGNPTTTDAILHKKKPRIGRLKVFGCPCVFKRYASHADGIKLLTLSNCKEGAEEFLLAFQRIKQVG